MNDDERQLARNAMTVQNLQIKLVGGMILGFLVGCALAAYIILPMGGLAIWVAVFTPIVGIFVGQRLVLSMLGR